MSIIGFNKNKNFTVDLSRFNQNLIETNLLTLINNSFPYKYSSNKKIKSINNNVIEIRRDFPTSLYFRHESIIHLRIDSKDNKTILNYTIIDGWHLFKFFILAFPIVAIIIMMILHEYVMILPMIGMTAFVLGGLILTQSIYYDESKKEFEDSLNRYFNDTTEDKNER